MMKIKLVTSAVCFSAFASLTLAATVNLDAYWNGTAGDTAGAFTRAIKAAGTGGTVKLKAKQYNTTLGITIDRKVKIIGAGKYNTQIVMTGSKNNLITLKASNVLLKNLTLNGSKKVINCIKSINKSKYLTCNSVIIKNAKSFGIDRAKGEALHGLKLTHCTLDNNGNIQVYICNRNWDFVAMPSIDKITVEHCIFSGARNRDLIMDAGNDSRNVATDMKSMLIDDNTFKKGPNMWHTGTVEAKNYSITNNHMEGPNNSSNWHHCIHLEQYCQYITISGNTLNNDKATGVNYIHGGDSDHGTPVVGPRNITVINNTFTGNAKTGLSLNTSHNCVYKNNHFNNASVSGNIFQLKGNNNKVWYNAIAQNKVSFNGSGNSFKN